MKVIVDETFDRVTPSFPVGTQHYHRCWLVNGLDMLSNFYKVSVSRSLSLERVEKVPYLIVKHETWTSMAQEIHRRFLGHLTIQT
jgi:hypothetical protein